MEISEKLQNKKYKADDKNEKMGASCIYKSSPISSSSSCPSIFPSSHHSASLIPPPTTHFHAMVLPRGSWRPIYGYP